MQYQFLHPDTKIKRPVGRPRTRTKPRKEYQREWYYLKRYGSTERMQPGFVKPKQVRKPRAEVEIEFYHLPALSEEDLMQK